MEDLFAHGTALFRVELRSVEVLIAQRGAEHHAGVLAGRDCVGAQAGVVGVDEIHVSARFHVLEEFALDVPEVVPAHVGHFAARSGGEAAHVGCATPG